MASSDTELPPAIQLLLSEFTEACDSPSDLQEAFRRRPGFNRELSEQASLSRRSWPYEGSPSSDDVLTYCPAGAFNPFAFSGKCGHPECMTETARSFCRTMGLYAERIVLSDPVTALVGMNDPADPNIAQHLVSTLAVLKTLSPLLKAGIIRFGPPVDGRYCEKHWHEFDGYCADLSQRLTSDLLDESLYRVMLDPTRSGSCQVQISYDRGSTFKWVTTDLSQVVNLRKSQDFTAPVGAEQVALRDYVQIDARVIARNLVFSAELAVQTHSALAAGDPTSARVLGDIKGRTIEKPKFEKLDKLRTINLPWVDRLSPQEILELRSRAERALPAFRSFVASTLRARADDESILDSTLELRTKAVEVEAELAALSSGHRWRTGLTVGSVGLSIALFASVDRTGVAAAALAAALAAISAVHSHTAGAQVEMAKLRSSPGYVLVKAKELAAHR